MFPLWSRVIPLWNRATSPLRVLLPLQSSGSTSDGPSTSASVLPTSEGALATESGPFYHRIRTSTQEFELFHIRSRVLLLLQSSGSTSEDAPATESGSFYHRIRTVTQEPESFHIRNPICPTTQIRWFHIRNRAIPPLNPARNLKSQGEFTASRQI